MKRIIEFIMKLFDSKKDNASLTIIGVGPGDSSLITIAALNAIKKSKIIFFPISGEYKKSFSAEIVKDYIKNKKKIPLVFPMAKKGFNNDKVWETSAKKITEYLNRNISVSLLCLGDTSIYASSSYIKNKIKEIYPSMKIKTIPGISSLSLAAALGDFQLIEQGEILKILECPNDIYEFTNLINNKSKTVLAIMKVGKRWRWVKNALEEKKILRQTLLAVNLGMTDQFIGKASDYISEELPYFSLLLIRL